MLEHFIYHWPALKLENIAVKSLLLASLVVMLGVTIGCSQEVSSPDRVTEVDDDDPGMAAAIAKARASLPEFWEKLDHHGPTETGFCLKVRITDRNGSEHFWLGNIERQDGKVYGTVDNDAQIVACVKFGDRIPIPNADISDWLYMRRGKMVGNHTIRALFKKMPPEEVESCKNMLENP